MGIPDDLVLATLLAEAVSSTAPGETSPTKAQSIRALQVYNNTRIGRTQWVGERSRVVGKLLEWRYLDTLQDYKIWHHDEQAMLRDARADFQQLLNKHAPENKSDGNSVQVIEVTVM